ncbi:MAG: PilC/PilY family type IV pilus protein, partial [Planctomycetota bacterium]
MLHAFDSSTGQEIWAYVPSAVLPNLYKLADKNYASQHRYFVDGSPVQGDVKIGTDWKTILVGGLGAGGRSYYALDVTDPDSPKALWEFSNPNLGVTLGKPEIAKLKNGTWVVLVASGYNNVSPGTGRGYLFVLDAATGSVIRSIDTGEGDTATPSGLAHIRAWVDNTINDNTVQRVYGGDNLGNVWRFDVNNDIGDPGYDAEKLAILRGATGNVQPVTARPELGLVDSNAVVYVGTGRYLGEPDLTSTDTQTIYAIKDKLTTSGYGNPRDALNKFVRQTLTDTTCSASAGTVTAYCAEGRKARSGSSNAVDLAADDGWYVDLPASGERATTDPQLVLGTLVFTTRVFSGDACKPAGNSFLNFFDYRNGGPV